MKKYTNTRTCSIGDGGNDVGMIQEAHLGVGIVGKEGKQASLAADFSILEFRSLKLLMLWHGRLSYKRSAVLSQFVIHRGLIISIIQVNYFKKYFFLNFFLNFFFFLIFFTQKGYFFIHVLLHLYPNLQRISYARIRHSLHLITRFLNCLRRGRGS